MHSALAVPAPVSSPQPLAARSTSLPAASVSASLHLAALVALCCVIVRPAHPPPPPPSFAIVVETPPPARSVEQALQAADLPAAKAAVAAPLATPQPLSLAATRAELSVSRRPPRPPVRIVAAAPLAAGASTPATPAMPPAAHGAAPQNILAGLEARIRQAVQDALIYPSSARIMHMQGRTQVRFDYSDGTADMIDVAIPSTSALLDRAALAAVRRAALPHAPAEIGNRRLALLVWVDFRLTSQ